MVFLHPDQVRLTERPFAGPARVRGAAGTGKTVVALHRARHLADTHDGTVLFTTYVSNLPPVFAELYRRLDAATAGRVEFINLHKWAWRFLARRGERPATDPQAVDAAFAAAWSHTVTADGHIRRRGYGRGYYREELDWVIKGRGLDRLDAYLALERTGRGSPLTEPHRREVWALYEEYQQELVRRAVVDFNDVLARALRLVRDGGLDQPYAAVIVDEAQDLTEVGVRLAYELAGQDKRDGLLLVGDGQQAVYPGGYSLRSVGIDVRGRSAVLRVNYRNTRQVLEAAGRLVEGRPFDDLDERPADGRRDVDCLREGEPPQYAAFEHDDDHDLALVAAIDEAARAPGCSPGDLAVLVPTNRLVDAYGRRIAELGYRTVKLERYEGRPSDEVKVGTYQRGKGLEFKWVFLPRLDPATLQERKRFNEDDDAYAERLDLLRRRLFVSMTRARDRLWLGWVGEPSTLLRLPAAVAAS
jgi:superfamily I DNA/RNA helicase